MKRYVLTGGPGSGKSTLILSLELSGEYVTREAAEDYIKLCQAKGISRPWEEEDFQLRIMNLCIQREAVLPIGIGRVFHDRGIPDGLAYQKPGTELFRKIQVASDHVSYDLIFLIGLLGAVERNTVRREDTDEAKRIEDKLVQIYRKLGYEPIWISPGDVDERLSEIKKYLNCIDTQKV